MIIERLKQIVEYKGLSIRAFAIKIGISSQVFGKYLKDREPSFDALRKIIETFDDISADWLLTGNGEMLKKNAGDVGGSEENTLYLTNNNRKLWDIIESQQRIIEQNANAIALLTQQLAQKGDAADAQGVARAVGGG